MNKIYSYPYLHEYIVFMLYVYMYVHFLFTNMESPDILCFATDLFSIIMVYHGHLSMSSHVPSQLLVLLSLYNNVFNQFFIDDMGVVFSFSSSLAHAIDVLVYIQLGVPW